MEAPTATWRSGEVPIGTSPPTTLGPYRLVEPLGEGGMGIVYLAEQTAPVRRRLALKLVRDCLQTPENVARFDSERQTLARLSHPNIGQMFEAGTTEDGHPYFAMELIEGEPLTTFCNRRRSTVDERLELFIAVCRGVHHAHQRGIIHRDLKPSNILVTEIEGKPVPKIIDFGVAKALEHPVGESTEISTGGLIGTPAYLCPEVLLSEDHLTDPDLRSDVYSLGVVLYELLSGVRPFDLAGGFAGMLQGAPTDPPVASVGFVGQAQDQTAMVARSRGTTAAELVRRLEDDLDAIVAKAIARQREQRYGTVAELVADLERHQRHEPVSVGPRNSRYRVGKFLRRHRGGVVAAAIVALALVLGFVGVVVGWVRAQKAEAEALASAERALAAEGSARQEARAARQVTDFLVDLFEVSDPTLAASRPGADQDVTARELLDRGSRRIEQDLAEQPTLQARMMATLGTIHLRLGALDRAEGLLERSLELRSQPGMAAEERVDGLQRLGDLYREQGRLDEARETLQQAVNTQEQTLGEDAVELVGTLRSLAAVYNDLGDFATSERLLRRALNLIELGGGADSIEAASVSRGLAVAFGYQGRFEEAEDLFRRSLAVREATLGTHPDVARDLASLALIENNLGNPEAAEELNRRALGIYEKTLGPDHPRVSLVLGNWGYYLFRQQEYERARPLLERAVAIDAKTFSHDHAHAASRLTNLGLVYWKLDRFDEAIPLFEQATELRARRLDPGHPHHATSLWGLANVYRDQGRHAEAEPLYRRALEIREAVLPADHAETIDALREYAKLLRRMGRDAEAAELEARIP